MQFLKKLWKMLENTDIKLVTTEKFGVRTKLSY